MNRIILLCITVMLSHYSFYQDSNYYFGNIHAHSDYSEGNQENLSAYDTPAESYEAAKEALHLDFLGISGHNHSKSEEGMMMMLR